LREARVSKSLAKSSLTRSSTPALIELQTTAFNARSFQLRFGGADLPRFPRETIFPFSSLRKYTNKLQRRKYNMHPFITAAERFAPLKYLHSQSMMMCFIFFSQNAKKLFQTLE
jgi:hypothetical protein